MWVREAGGWGFESGAWFSILLSVRRHKISALLLDLARALSRVLRRSVSPKSKVPGRWDQRWINDKRLGNGPKLQGDRWVLWFKGGRAPMGRGRVTVVEVKQAQGDLRGECLY